MLQLSDSISVRRQLLSHVLQCTKILILINATPFGHYRFAFYTKACIRFVAAQIRKSSPMHVQVMAKRSRDQFTIRNLW